MTTRLIHNWRRDPVYVAGRCPGNGHESVPWNNGPTIECAVCERAMPIKHRPDPYFVARSGLYDGQLVPASPYAPEGTYR